MIGIDRKRVFASSTVALAVNGVGCAIQLLAVGIDVWTGQWTWLVAPAIGAGVSAGLIALIRSAETRDRLWTEKMQVDIAAAKCMNAMLEQQHDAMQHGARHTTAESRH